MHGIYYYDAWLYVIWVASGKPQPEQRDLAKHSEDDSAVLDGYTVSNKQQFYGLNLLFVSLNCFYGRVFVHIMIWTTTKHLPIHNLTDTLNHLF